MGVKIASKEELASQSGRPLPEDRYVGEVTKIEPVTSPNPFQKGPDGEPVERTQLKVTWALLSFEDGSELVNEDGDPVEERSVNRFIDPNRTGFMKNGKAAIARKFFAASLGVDVEDDMEIDSYDDLLGAKMGLQLGIQKTENGRFNRVEDIFPLKKKIRRRSDAEAKSDAESLLAKARETFSGDIASESSEDGEGF